MDELNRALEWMLRKAVDEVINADRVLAIAERLPADRPLSHVKIGKSAPRFGVSNG